MSTGAIIIVVVVAVVVAAALAVRVVRGGAGRRERVLRRHFGPEYELSVAEHAGDAPAAHRELEERLARYRELRTGPLSGELRERYVAEWAGAQELFIESPERAVATGDQLLARLARDRGYPSDSYAEQAAALSVHHARCVQGYRQIHNAAARAREGLADTEELREAVVHARPFFEELVKPPHHGEVHQVPTPAPRTTHRSRRDSGRWELGLGHTKKGGAW
ncbi:hypothetical protein [Streptomyces coffeae]|uniref:Secreted protein n=1 Tax=Streptomyces coffeae TaxID=621382 RepID=A0ABS1NJE9_9ACTN|nr:hypothetical protein [Streptomyces coffeae]MBL1100193.1 hypothetical protein [Streptomyces coffeae]